MPLVLIFSQFWEWEWSMKKFSGINRCKISLHNRWERNKKNSWLTTLAARERAKSEQINSVCVEVWNGQVAMAFLLICTIILIVCAVKYIFRNKALYTFADQIPGPKAYAVIGSAHKFLKKNEKGKTCLCKFTLWILLPTNKFSRQNSLNSSLFFIHRKIFDHEEHDRQIPEQ